MSFEIIEIIKNGGLEYSYARNLDAPHAFTTRLGGVSEGIFLSMNIAMHRGDEAKNVIKNYEILAENIGFDVNDLVLTRQTHSDIVRVVTKADACGLDHHDYPESDALITNDAGCALVVFTADCTPILLWDSVTGAVGAVHAGWRGTVSDIAGKTVRKMVTEFGCDPRKIRAAIGPNIGFCCFETDRDVPDAIIAEFGAEAEAFIRKTGEKYQVDLKAVNAFALRRAGVESIEISKECTMCSSDRYWSHRITGNNRGSQGAIIVCGKR
ncbi:MAG: peptidoglycan editing factor PgeF [Clostridia bacterium]|nr:peptidoglycan editing factor PgeF [Clostridia bacterium]